MAKFVLAKVLKRKRLSKRQLAKLMGKPYFSVFRLFRTGYNPTLKSMNEIAEALQCRVRDLLEE
jgi:transcriptional regulator with XRE-family HTH domain